MFSNFVAMTRLEIAKTCKAKRIELGMTQQQLADSLGLFKPRISEFENNKSNLQFDTLERMCSILELRLEVINNI